MQDGQRVCTALVPALLMAVVLLLPLAAAAMAEPVPAQCVRVHVEDFMLERGILLTKCPETWNPTSKCTERCRIAIQRLGYECSSHLKSGAWVDQSLGACKVAQSELTPCFPKEVSVADQDQYAPHLLTCPLGLNDTCYCDESKCASALWHLGRRCAKWLAANYGFSPEDAYWDQLFPKCNISIGGFERQDEQPPCTDLVEFVQQKANETVVVVQAALADEVSISIFFEQWMVGCGYQFTTGSEEYSTRISIFRINMESVLRINLDVTIVTYWVGPNCFSHLTPEEWAASYLGLPDLPVPDSEPVEPPPVERGQVVDWVLEGKVTPVKNQDQCGSCWAFAVTAALESKYMISSNKSFDFPNLSEQQLVDCMTTDKGLGITNDPQTGCDGGWPHEAFAYLTQYGLASEDAYPYSASSDVCNLGAEASAGAVKVTTSPGYAYLPANSSTALLNSVAAQPTLVGLNVGPGEAFFQYKGGLYAPPDCTESPHVVLVVGFDTTGASTGSPSPYWKAKNSWGVGWGEGGYFRIKMEPDGSAGICDMYSYMMVPLDVSDGGSVAPSPAPADPWMAPSPTTVVEPPLPANLVPGPAPDQVPAPAPSSPSSTSDGIDVLPPSTGPDSIDVDAPPPGPGNVVDEADSPSSAPKSPTPSRESPGPGSKRPTPSPSPDANVEEAATPSPAPRNVDEEVSAPTASASDDKPADGFEA